MFIQEKDHWTDFCLGHTFIAMSYNGKEYRERLTEGDLQSLHQDERTLNDLAYKYFAYLMML